MCEECRKHCDYGSPFPVTDVVGNIDQITDPDRME
jgi:hypothetical protein